ncbi:MAG: DJ-1/PfpI family protein [bacterium]|nr:DJ-1/PfpI family protein [bacterium]
MGKITGKKILIVIASDRFRDEEYKHPRIVLEKEGAEITVGSSSLNVSNGVKGMEKVKPDILLKDVSTSDYDTVVFVGGAGAREYFNDPVAQRIAKEMFNENKIVGAICIAPVILANAGLLKGKKATVFSSEIDTIKAKGANYTGNPVEQDGKIITAIGPEAAYDFGKKIVEAIK